MQAMQPLVLLAIASLVHEAFCLTISTRVNIPKVEPGLLHDFLATPANWPKIVLSSWSVEGEHTDVPCVVGSQVDEIFGLPPVLPLRVRWTCMTSDRDLGALVFESQDGLRGVASNCKMSFAITKEEAGSTTEVELTMCYDPASPLAIAALPVLMLDNAIALMIQLPRAVSPSPLGKMDPIAGPLISAARSLGLMQQEEEDGWTGEP